MSGVQEISLSNTPLDNTRQLMQQACAENPLQACRAIPEFQRIILEEELPEKRGELVTELLTYIGGILTRPIDIEQRNQIINSLLTSVDTFQTFHWINMVEQSEKLSQTPSLAYPITGTFADDQFKQYDQYSLNMIFSDENLSNLQSMFNVLNERISEKCFSEPISDQNLQLPSEYTIIRQTTNLVLKRKNSIDINENIDSIHMFFNLIDALIRKSEQIEPAKAKNLRKVAIMLSAKYNSTFPINFAPDDISIMLQTIYDRLNQINGVDQICEEIYRDPITASSILMSEVNQSYSDRLPDTATQEMDNMFRVSGNEITTVRKITTPVYRLRMELALQRDPEQFKMLKDARLAA